MSFNILFLDVHIYMSLIMNQLVARFDADFLGIVFYKSAKM